MNIENHLILIKHEDKTAQVEYCKYDHGKWHVKFCNSNKSYAYNLSNVEWCKTPAIIDPQVNLVFINDQQLSGISKILKFNQYIRIIFKTGYHKVYPASSIHIEESCLKDKLSSNCFEYLNKLAGHIEIKTEDDIGFLSMQYSSLQTISPRSVLAKYLGGLPLKKEKQLCQPIFPFSFNLSQKAATEKALTEQISIIEGPPGTGKTQTILNIIANIILSNKTVAVVSNNNSATANVLEKLEKYGVNFFAAYLGNEENKQKFINEQKNTYPDMSNWKMSSEVFQTMRKSLQASQIKLNEMLKIQNRQADLKSKHSSLQTEAEYFYQYYKESDVGFFNSHFLLKLKADKILSFLLKYKQALEKGSISYITKLYNLFVYGIYNFMFYNNTPEAIVSFIQKSYYDKKLEELQNKIEILAKKLEDYHFDYAMKEYSEISMKLFKAQLAERYGNGNRIIFSKNDLLNKTNIFIKEYPLILSTTHSLRRCIGINYLFDYVIMDEASQVDLVSGALALSCAKNAVIVGDIKQLPNVVPVDVANVAKQIFDTYQLNNAYNYVDNSLLSSFVSLYKDIPRTLLQEHYRCHPKIIGFCNQKFYNNQLIILTSEKDNDKPLMLYKTTKGRHARGRLNQRQIDVIFEEVIPQQNIMKANQSVGIVSPFRLQTEELKKVIGERNIEADTVHKYQGREKDVIILTTVANEVSVNDFVDNPNLINVAVSRAVKKLIVVVSEGSEEWKGTNIGDLVRYIRYNNFEIFESQIYSVFDLLYSCYSEKLLKVLKKSRKVSKYNSENLMNIIIEEVLSLPEFQNLERVMHQPLRMLIKDSALLDDNEYKYAMNILTHTDFLIFNKLDKLPVLVVEVDGYSFHANNPKQLERDKMKDNILRKYGIPILRVKTNESSEKQKLYQALKEIMRIKS